MHNDDRAERFSKAVRKRRADLGLTHAQVTDLGGPSDTTMTKVENQPTSVRGDVHRKLDVALGWMPGSSRQLWEDGTEPQLVAGPPPRASELTDDELMAELGRRLTTRRDGEGNGSAAPNAQAGNARDDEIHSETTGAANVPSGRVWTPPKSATREGKTAAKGAGHGKITLLPDP